VLPSLKAHCQALHMLQDIQQRRRVQGLDVLGRKFDVVALHTLGDIQQRRRGWVFTSVSSVNALTVTE